jgi:hypothetical protein
MEGRRAYVSPSPTAGRRLIKRHASPPFFADLATSRGEVLVETFVHDGGTGIWHISHAMVFVGSSLFGSILLSECVAGDVSTSGNMRWQSGAASSPILFCLVRSVLVGAWTDSSGRNRKTATGREQSIIHRSYRTKRALSRRSQLAYLRDGNSRRQREGGRRRQNSLSVTLVASMACLLHHTV